MRTTSIPEASASPQVLQEFYVTVTRKLPTPLAKKTARSVVEAYSVWCINVTPADVAVAFAIEDSPKLGFWDALIIASAAKAGATTFLSEDLNANQTVTGVRIENPFA